MGTRTAGIAVFVLLVAGVTGALGEPKRLDDDTYDGMAYTKWLIYPTTTDCTGPAQGSEVWLPKDYCYATSTSSSEKYTTASDTQVTVSHYDSDATCSGSSTAVTYTKDVCASRNSASRVLLTTPEVALDKHVTSDTWHDLKTTNYVNFLWWWASDTGCSIATVRPYMINARDGTCYALTSDRFYRTYESKNRDHTTNPSEKLVGWWPTQSDCNSGLSSTRLELSMATNKCEASGVGGWYNHFYYNNFDWATFWLVCGVICLWGLFPLSNMSFCLYVYFANLDTWNGGYVYMFITSFYCMIYLPGIGFYIFWALLWVSITVGRNTLTGHIVALCMSIFLPGNFILMWIPLSFVFEYFFGWGGVFLLYAIVLACAPVGWNWVMGYPLSACFFCAYVAVENIDEWSGGIYLLIWGCFSLMYPVVGPYVSWAFIWGAMSLKGMGMVAHAIAAIWALYMPGGVWLMVIPVAVACGSIHPAATFVILSLAFACCIYPTDPFSQVTLRYIVGFPISMAMWWAFIANDDIDDLNGGANWFVVAIHAILIPVAGPYIFHFATYFGLLWIDKTAAMVQMTIGLLSLPYGLWTMWLPIIVYSTQSSPVWVTLFLIAVWVAWALPLGIWLAWIPTMAALIILDAPEWLILFGWGLWFHLIWPFYGNLPCVLLTSIAFAVMIPGPWYFDWLIVGIVWGVLLPGPGWLMFMCCIFIFAIGIAENS